MAADGLKLNLDVFMQCVEGLSYEVENDMNEQNTMRKTMEESINATEKAHALLDGLKGLFGIDDFRVGCDDTGRIQIFVTFGDLRACLSLDAKSNNKLLDLQILSDAMKSKADAAEMLSSCATLSSPDDIKQAMFYLRSSQLSQQAIKKDVIELRKKIIVTSKGPYLFDVTFQSGATATLKVHMSYPHFVGGVVVENISTSYDVSTPSLDAESIKIHANKIMCSTLAEMYCVLNDRFT